MAPKAKPSQRTAAAPAPRKRMVAAIVPAPTPIEIQPKIQPIVTLKGNPVMKNSFDNVTATAREQLEKASQSAYKGYEDLTKLQKDNWEAVVAASQIWTKGAESVGKAWMSLAQESMEHAASTAKALVGVKSLREAVDLQTDFAKGSFDKMVAEGTKLSETAVKVANDAMEPITARMNVTVEKLFKPLAA